jgi:hypothetical protein
MLQDAMRISLVIAVVLLPFLGTAQVQLDVPVVLTGVPAERRVDSLAPPTIGTSLVTVEGAVHAEWQWAAVQAQGSTINLTLSPAVTSYADGLLLRFLVPADIAGTLAISADGLPALPLLRPDGLPPVVGQLRQGSIAEVMHAGGRFILLSAAERGCPPGSLAVNERFCIDQASTNDVIFYDAVDRCAVRGGRLCTWDEYHAACVLLTGELSGMFNEWEWVDDTANHTQTAGQVGRTTCLSQRSAGAPLTTEGDVRCCYHPR